MIGNLMKLSIRTSTAAKVWLVLCVWVTLGLSAVCTWTGGGGNDFWSTAANWAGTAPVAGDDIVFAGGTRLTPNNDIAGGTIFTSITINSGAGNFIIGGNSIQLSGGATAIACNVNSGNIAINNAITFITSAPTVNVVTGGSLALGGGISLGSFSVTLSSAGYTGISGIISGTGAVTKTGNGELLLGGSNSYSGTTSISAGVLKLNNSSALGTTGSGTTIYSGAALDLNGINYSSAEPLTLNGTGISSGGAIFNSSATNAYFAGQLTLGSASSIIAASGPIQITYAGNITGSFGLTLGGAFDGTVMCSINTSSASVTKQDGGTWTFSGSNVYSGATNINGGTLRVGNSNALGTAAGGTTVATGAALDLNGFNYSMSEPLTINGSGVSSGGAIMNSSGTSASFGGLISLGSSSSIVAQSGGITISNAGTITGSGFNLTLDGTTGCSLVSVLATGAGGLIKEGTGAWLISGTNTYTGTTTINGGALILNNTSALGSSTGGTVINAGGTLDLNGVNYTTNEPTTINGSGGGSGCILNGSSGTANYNGLIVLGSNSVIKTGPGSGGINLTNSGIITGNFNLTLGGANNGSLVSVLGNGGASSLTKEDASGWLISGANNYSGSTVVTGGTLKLGASGTIPDASPLTVNGTLDLSGFSETIGSLTGSGAVTNTSGAGIYTLTAGGDNTSTTFSGVIQNTTGTVQLTKTGTGTLTLSGTNSYDGATTVSNGTLKLGNASALGTATAGTTISNGGVLDLNGTNYTGYEALAIAGTGGGSGVVINSSATAATYAGLITLTAASTISGATGTIAISNTGAIIGSYALTLGGASGGNFASTFNGGAGVLVKQDAGTWTFTGSNPKSLYSLTLSAGTLNLGSSFTHTISNSISITGGSIDFGSAILEIQAATVDLHLLSSLTPGTGTLKFTGSSAQTFTPKASTTLPNIIQYGTGGTTVVTNGITCASLTLRQGPFDLGTSLSHSVTTLSDGGSSPYGSINFNSSQLNISGDASIGNLTSLVVGSGSMRFDGSSGTQLFTPVAGGVTHPTIFHVGASELKLVNNDLTCVWYSQSAGSLNFNSQNITTTTDFTITNGTTSSMTGLASRTIIVGGNASFTGTSAANRINLNPGAAWSINATGTLTATYATVMNCTSTNAATCANCSNGGTNSGNWVFDVSWIGGGGNSNWSTAANWNNGAVPTTTDDVTFSSSANNVILDTAASIKSITMTSGYTGVFDFGSNTLTITSGNADFSSGGSITAGSGTLVFTSGTAQTLIPSSGATFPNITQNGAGGTTISTNALSAGDLAITSGTFTLGSGFTHSIKNVSGSGTLTMGSSNLNVTGNMSVTGLAGLSGTGTIAFTSTSPQTFTPKSGATYPPLKQYGSGGTTVLTNGFTTPTLTIASGTLALGTSLQHTVTNLNISMGGLDFGSSTLSVSGATVDLHLLVTLTPGTGNLKFTGSSPQTFIPKVSSAHPNIWQYGTGGTMITTNALIADGLTLFQGTFNLGTGLSHTFTSVSDGGGGPYGNINFGSSQIHTTGNVSFNNTPTLTAGTGSIYFEKSTGTQLFTPKTSTTHPAIYHTGAGTLQLYGNNLTCNSFSQNAGILDFNGKNLTTVSSGNLSITNANSSSILNLTGRTIVVNGTTNFSGASSGSPLNLNPGAAWTLNSNGALTASLVSLDFSNATGSTSTGTCTNCANGGNNTKWDYTSNWAGAGGNANWSTPANWASGTVPSSEDDIVFNSTSANATVDASASIKSITFTSGYTGTLNLGSNSLTINKGNADFSSGGTITANSGSLIFTSSSAQTFIPKSGVTFNNVTQNGSGTTTISGVSLNAASLNITLGTLNLGTSLTHNFGVISGSGGLNFGTSSCNTSGNVDFSTLTITASNANTLKFNGTSAQTFIPNASATSPNLTQDGSGGTTIGSNDFTTPTLTITSGTLTLGSGHNHIVSGTLTVTGGGLDFGSSTLKVAAPTINFTSLSSFNANSGTLMFTGTGAQTFTPKASTGLPPIVQNGSGGTTLSTNPISSSTLTISSGTLNLGTSLNHSVSSLSSTAGGLDFSSSTLEVNTGNADFSGLATLTASTGKLVFSGSTGTQILTPKSGGTLPFIEHNNGAILQLAGYDLNCAAFRNISGQFDFNNKNLTIVPTGYFDVWNGTSATLTNLAGRTITVNGNATLRGLANNHINLNPTATWNLNVTGTLLALNADIRFSNVSGTTGQADSSLNLNNNNNWNFLDSIKPNNVTAFVANKSGLHEVAMSWTNTTSTDADSIMIRYRTNGAYPANYTDGTLYHKISATKTLDTATGLTDKTKYNFAAFVKDSSGNWSLSSTTAQDTAVLPDVTAPNNVTALVATSLTASKSLLTWTASVSSDGDTTMVRYRADGIFPTSPSDGILWKKLPVAITSDTVIDLTTNVIYSFATFVRDSSGNYSSNSTSAQDTSLFQSTPAGTIALNNNSGKMSAPKAALTFTYSFADSLRFSLVTDTATAIWRVLHTSDSIDIASGVDGKRVLAYQLKNKFGKRSSWFKDSTILDRQGPVVNWLQDSVFGYRNWPSTIYGKAKDEFSGTDTVYVTKYFELDQTYYNGSTWASTIDTSKISTDSLFSTSVTNSTMKNGFFQFRAFAKDKLGNLGAVQTKRFYYQENRAPEFVSGNIPDTLLQNSNINLTLDIGDLDMNDTVLSQSINIPSWMTYTTTLGPLAKGYPTHRIYTLHGIPTQSQIGFQTFTISASDMGGKSITITKTFIVKDMNDPPKFSANQNSLNVTEDAVTNWTPKYSDPDLNDNHSFTLLQAPPWVSLQDTVFTFSPSSRDVGTKTLKIRLSDGSIYDTLNLQVTVINVNDAPVAFPYSNLESPVVWKQNKNNIFKVLVVDMDISDAIQLASPLPSYLSSKMETDSTNPYNRIFTFVSKPSLSDTGTKNLTLQFSDKANSLTQIKITAKIQFVNTPPIALIVSKQNLAGAAKIVLDVNDSDGSLAQTRFRYKLTTKNGAMVRVGIVSGSQLILAPLVDGEYSLSLQAEDEGGMVQVGNTQTSFTIQGASTLSLTNSVWNMAAFPANSLSASVLGTGNALTSWDEATNDGQPLGKYSAGKNIDSLKMGKGYWVRVAKDITLSLNQKDLVDTALKIKLTHRKQGWNQIGNPYPYYINVGSSKLVYWEWDAKTRDLINVKGILKPWGAYWVQVPKDTLLIVKNEPYFNTTNIGLGKLGTHVSEYPDAQNWSMQLLLQSGQYQDAANYMGVQKNQFDKQSSEIADAPKIADYIALHFEKLGQGSSTLNQNYAQDIRIKMDPEEEWWDFSIENAGTDLSTAALKIPELEQVLATGLHVFLVRKGVAVALRSQTAAPVDMNDSVTHYSIVVTPHADFAEKLGGNFNVFQNFPNPVRNQTTFQFFLPQTWDPSGKRESKTYHTRLNLYDFSGRLIANIAAGEFGSGSHSLIWQPQNKNGKPIPMGQYIYRLEIPEFTKSLKLLVK